MNNGCMCSVLEHHILTHTHPISTEISRYGGSPNKNAPKHTGTSVPVSGECESQDYGEEQYIALNLRKQLLPFFLVSSG